MLVAPASANSEAAGIPALRKRPKGNVASAVAKVDRVERRYMVKTIMKNTTHKFRRPTVPRSAEYGDRRRRRTSM
jgi:hypothetical protein